MSQPFVISMKIVGDAGSAVSAANDTRAAYDQLSASIKGSTGGVQGRINDMFGLGGAAGARQSAADVAAYGAQLDQLRGKYNPLFAVIRQYKQYQSEVREANRLGAISENEMTAAIDRQRTATLSQIAAIKGGTGVGGARTGQSAFTTANIAAQFQDIGVTTAMGMSPLQIALQQGTQLSAALGNQGVTGTVASLGAAFASIISPVSLLTIGIIGVGAASVQWLGGMLPKMETANEALKRHEGELKSIVAGYDAAESSADAYFKSASRRPAGAVLSDLDQQFEEAKAATKKFQDYVALVNNPGAAGLRLPDSVNALIKQFDAGTISIGEMQTELTELKNSDLGPLGFALKPFIADLADAAKKAGSLYDTYIAFEHIKTDVSRDTRLGNILTQKVEHDRSASSFDAQLAGISARSPAQLAENARLQKKLELQTSNLSAGRQQQEIDQAGALAYAQAAHSIGMADDARLRGMRDSIAVSQLDQLVIGESIARTQELEFAQRNLAAAQAAAAQSGTAVSAAQRAEIEQLAKAYGDLQQQVALTQLRSNISFDRDQLGRTAGEQQIASQLRPIFGDDLTSSQAQFVGQQLRVNQVLTELKTTTADIAKGGLAAFNQSLQQGTGLLGSFANAASNAFGQISQKFFEYGIDQLVSSLFNGGGGSGGSWVDGLLKSFGLGGNSGGNGPLAWAGLPHNASGTDFWRGGPTGIHERGGEIIDLPTGTRIIPHDVSMAMASGGGGGRAEIVFAPNQTINIIGSGVSMADVRHAVQTGNENLVAQLPLAIAAFAAAPRRR